MGIRLHRVFLAVQKPHQLTHNPESHPLPDQLLYLNVMKKDKDKCTFYMVTASEYSMMGSHSPGIEMRDLVVLLP